MIYTFPSVLWRQPQTHNKIFQQIYSALLCTGRNCLFT